MFVIGRSLINAEHVEELERAEEESLFVEEKCREKEKRKKKMGETEDMTIHFLKEVLDEFNVTYRASEKKADLIAKVHQARANLHFRIT